MTGVGRQHIESEIVDSIPALRRFSRTLARNPSDRDDLVQETLVKALSSLDQFQSGTNLKSWLFTIMKNTFCTRHRRSAREVGGCDEYIAQATLTAPEQEWKLQGRELESACGQIPPVFRETFQFVFIEGESYESAAAHFNCAVGTIKSRVNRARRFVADALGEPQAAQA